jgi:hypothetical protein
VLAVAAASHGSGTDELASSVDALSFDWAAAVAGDKLEFDTPAACDALPPLSPSHAASATVIANKTEINPTPLDIMTSSYKTKHRIRFRTFSYANLLTQNRHGSS